MQVLETFATHFDEEDDSDLWRTALEYILIEVEPGSDLPIEVGRCSHWYRPHQTRWTAAGGFAFPVGYTGLGFPELDWSVFLARSGDDWGRIGGHPPRTSLRLAIPSRTRRHRQAALHASWLSGREREVVFYGFRKRADGWSFTARGESRRPDRG